MRCREREQKRSQRGENKLTNGIKLVQNSRICTVFYRRAIHTIIKCDRPELSNLMMHLRCTNINKITYYIKKFGNRFIPFIETFRLVCELVDEMCTLHIDTNEKFAIRKFGLVLPSFA